MKKSIIFISTILAYTVLMSIYVSLSVYFKLQVSSMEEILDLGVRISEL